MKKWNSIKIIKYLGKSFNGLIRQKQIFKKKNCNKFLQYSTKIQW